MVIKIQFSDIHEYIDKCIKYAKASSCLRSKCGSVIVKEGVIIGWGWNSPPCDEIFEKCRKDSLPINFKSDKTCCIHAEQRAIMCALANNGSISLKGSRIYFVRLGENGNFSYSGAPYCTICSKMFLDAAGKCGEWVLGHDAIVYGKEGFYVYKADEYNDISFKYKE